MPTITHFHWRSQVDNLKKKSRHIVCETLSVLYFVQPVVLLVNKGKSANFVRKCPVPADCSMLKLHSLQCNSNLLQTATHKSVKTLVCYLFLFQIKNIKPP